MKFHKLCFFKKEFTTRHMFYNRFDFNDMNNLKLQCADFSCGRVYASESQNRVYLDICVHSKLYICLFCNVPMQHAMHWCRLFLGEFWRQKITEKSYAV